jgi:hypothetical protein
MARGWTQVSEEGLFPAAWFIPTDMHTLNEPYYILFKTGTGFL